MSDEVVPVRRAWRVTWGGVESVVSETTASRARQAVCRSARGAGYRPKYVDIRGRREPALDEWAARTRYRVVDEAFARREWDEMQRGSA